MWTAFLSLAKSSMTQTQAASGLAPPADDFAKWTAFLSKWSLRNVLRYPRPFKEGDEPDADGARIRVDPCASVAIDPPGSPGRLVPLC
jgi:hypothetical protein